MMNRFVLVALLAVLLGGCGGGGGGGGTARSPFEGSWQGSYSDTLRSDASVLTITVTGATITGNIRNSVGGSIGTVGGWVHVYHIDNMQLNFRYDGATMPGIAVGTATVTNGRMIATLYTRVQGLLVATHWIDLLKA